MQKLKSIGFVFLGILVVFLLGWKHQKKKFIGFIENDTTVNLTRIKILGRAREAVLTDSESLDYLRRMIKTPNAVHALGSEGGVYTMRLYSDWGYMGSLNLSVTTFAEPSYGISWGLFYPTGFFEDYGRTYCTVGLDAPKKLLNLQTYLLDPGIRNRLWYDSEITDIKSP